MVPNHHADFPGFSGLSGLVAAVTMLPGGTDDARLAQQLSGLGAGDTLVDVGCGPGPAVRYAARLGATAIGVDPAPVMLRIARLVTRGARGARATRATRATRAAGHARFAEGRAEAIPVPDGSATVLWSVACVHHWRDLDAGLAEAGRVLAPGGRLVAIERRCQPGADGLASHGWTDAQAAAFAESCSAAGFERVQIGQHTVGRRPTVSVTAVNAPAAG